MNPMMSDKEIALIDNLLKERQPKYCLELGAGGSTLHFSSAVNIEYWRSIEHNGHWYHKIRPQIKDNTDIIWNRDDKEDTYFKEALLYKYDFVLIDGLNRTRAIELLPELLNKGGWALLHDSGREEYKDVNKKGEVLIEGEKKLDNGFYAHRGLTLFIN